MRRCRPIRVEFLSIIFASKFGLCKALRLTFSDPSDLKLALCSTVCFAESHAVRVRLPLCRIALSDARRIILVGQDFENVNFTLHCISLHCDVVVLKCC